MGVGIAELWSRLRKLGLTVRQTVKCVLVSRLWPRRAVDSIEAALKRGQKATDEDTEHPTREEVQAEIARLQAIAERIRNHQPIGDLLKPHRPGWPGDAQLQTLEPKVRLLFLWPVPLVAQGFELLVDVHCPLCRQSESLMLDLPWVPTGEECIRRNGSIEQLLARARKHQLEHGHFVLDLEAELDRVRALNAHLAQENVTLASQLRDARGGIPDRWR